MMWVGRGEVVKMGDLFPGGIPTCFAWRGRRHRIRSMEAVPPSYRRGRGESKARDFFQIRTTDGLRCRLSRGKRRGDWRMERVVATGGR